MCHDCYMEYVCGEEPVVTSDMRNAKILVETVYRLPGCSLGGPLHVIVEDMNVDDRMFKEPLSFRFYEDMSDEDKRLCNETFQMLKGLTVQERAWVTYYQGSA